MIDSTYKTYKTVPNLNKFLSLSLGIQYDTCRFERLKETHPRLYEYCMYNIKMKYVIDYLKENGML